jgi:hypothetical protein
MSRRAVAPGQLDMFTVIEEAKYEKVPACLYHSPARGLAARAADFEQWVAEWGNFGSGYRAHAWVIGSCVPSAPADRCQATVLHVDARCPRWAAPGGMPDCTCCTEIDDYLFRGACRGCDWEGDPHRDGRENPAVEDAMDHAWPGWRDVPIVARYRQEQKARERWVAKVLPQYPVGWLQAGGPIRTLRDKCASRHNAGQVTTPWAGYDMGVIRPPTHYFTAVSKTGQPSGVPGIDAGVTVPVWGEDDLRWRVSRAAEDPDLEVTVRPSGGAG